MTTRSFFLFSVISLLSFGPGCTLGLRASGGCPAGEVCSDLTPDGLIFVGDLVQGGSDPFVPVAARGTRRVGFGVPGAGVRMPAYEVLTSDPSVASATDAPTNGALIEGHEAGRSLLRIVSATDGGLLDAVPIRVEEIARAELTPGRWLQPAPGTAGWAFYPGVALDLSLSLIAGDGTMLVDEGASVEGLTSNLGRWDSYYTEGLAEGTPGITVRAGERDLRAEVLVTSELEALSIPSLDTALVDGDYRSFCVIGLAAGRSVFGAPVALASGEGVTVFPVGPSAPGCGMLNATAPGLTYVEASLGALSVRVQIDVAPAMEGMTSSPLSSATPALHAPVTRARGLRGL